MKVFKAKISDAIVRFMDKIVKGAHLHLHRGRTIGPEEKSEFFRRPVIIPFPKFVKGTYMVLDKKSIILRGSISAASGRESEQSEWQRSIADEGL